MQVIICWINLLGLTCVLAQRRITNDRVFVVTEVCRSHYSIRERNCQLWLSGLKWFHQVSQDNKLNQKVGSLPLPSPPWLWSKGASWTRHQVTWLNRNFIPTGFPLCRREGSVLQPVPASGMCGKFSIWQCDHWGKYSLALHTRLNYQRDLSTFWCSVIHFVAGKTSRRFKNACISKVNVDVYTCRCFYNCFLLYVSHRPYCVENYASLAGMEIMLPPLLLTCNREKEFGGDGGVV